MDGVWVTHFNAGAAHGSGIAVLRSGEILGGDFSHSWVGTYQEEGSQLYARVHVAPHSAEGEGDAAQREQPFELTLSGFRTDRHARLLGQADESTVPVSIEMHQAV
jgi:hypothetical protein